MNTTTITNRSAASIHIVEFLDDCAHRAHTPEPMTAPWEGCVRYVAEHCDCPECEEYALVDEIAVLDDELSDLFEAWQERGEWCDTYIARGDMEWACHAFESALRIDALAVEATRKLRAAEARLAVLVPGTSFVRGRCGCRACRPIG